MGRKCPYCGDLRAVPHKSEGGITNETGEKERVGILMPPSQVPEIDALYPLHGHASRSDFVCKAVEFYTGFLQQDGSEFYISRTTLAFLEEQLGKLESRICRQLFRMCVEQEMACHLFASQSLGEPKETLEELRRNCVRAVKRTTGSIRYGRIYAYQRGGLEPDEDEDGEEN